MAWFCKDKKEPKTEKYPIDFDSLKKGDRICTAVLEEILQVKAGRSEFQTKGLNFAKKVEQELARRGMDCIVKLRQESLHILTDSEAVEYISRTNRMGCNKINSAFNALGIVDYSKLNADDKNRYDRAVVVVSMVYQGVTEAVRRIPAIQNRAKYDKPFVPYKEKKIL